MYTSHVPVLWVNCLIDLVTRQETEEQDHPSRYRGG